MAYKSRLTRDKQAQLKSASDIINVQKTIVNGEEVYTINSSDLDKLSEVYDVSDGQPKIVDKNSKVVLKKNSEGKLQIMHNGSSSRTAIEIHPDGRIDIKAKDLNGDYSDYKGGQITLRPNGDSNPEVEIRSAEGGTKLRLGESYGIKFAYDNDTQILEINDDEVVVKSNGNERLKISKTGDFSIKNEEGNNVLLSNERRTILYHNGDQILYINPSQLNEDGEETEPYFQLKQPDGTILIDAPKTSETGEDVQLLLGARIRELIGKKALLNLSFQRFTIAANTRININQYVTPLINKMWGDTILTAPFAGVATIHADIQAIDATGQNAALVAYISVNNAEERFIKGIITSSTSTSIRINLMEVVELNEGDAITMDLQSLNQSITIDANSRINVQLQQYNE
jgi:hypothetical protein